MKYYEIALIKPSAPLLTYASAETLESGRLVSVPLKSTTKDAVIIDEVDKPTFKTEEILSVSEKYYASSQMQMAKFISEYYFSSFSEAISLFLPFSRLGSSLLDKNMQNEVLMMHDKSAEEKTPRPTLSGMQEKAYKQILKKQKSLLFGVTGSGKTEIFISLFSKMLAEGKTSIFLMPEISLTPQMEKRLKVYFGDK